MSVLIAIGELLHFSANNGIIIDRDAAASADAGELIAAIRLAADHLGDPELVEECCGNGHPMFAGSSWVMSYDDYVARLERSREQDRIAEATWAAKRYHVSRRRGEFGRVRSDLVLKLLNLGVPYICAGEGCTEVDDLQLDHIEPLSRGGTDEPSNLQFLCRRHNSAKSDRVPSR